MTASLSDDLRRLNQFGQRFFSSVLKKGIIASSSGVCRLAEPSDEQLEPGVSAGRERIDVDVSTGVLGAFAKRDVERDLARRGKLVGVDWADVVELDSDLPPRPNDRAEAKERMGGDGGEKDRR